MAQQPSRRDIWRPPPQAGDVRPTVRHLGQAQRSMDPGYLGGRWATPKPVPGGPSQIVGGEGDGDPGDSVIGEDGDRLTLANLKTQTWRLNYDPISETVHVRWHLGGHGGLPLVRTDHWNIDEDDNVITITADQLAAMGAQVGDVFTAQYLRLEGEQGPDEINPSVVGHTAPGDWDSTADTTTFDMPDGTVENDTLVLTARGWVAPGGGELTDAVSCSDPRMTLVFSATSLNSGHVVVESVWVGTADGSGDPIVVNVTNPSFPTSGCSGVLATIRGVNGVGTVSTSETTNGSTPTIAGTAAVAAVWARGNSFSIVNALPPDGYTDISSCGSGYSSTGLSFWYDPAAASSPSGDFIGEGCCVIPLV